MDNKPDILCIGSMLWDIIGRTGSDLPTGADVPGRILRLPGGVALNIAMALARAGLRPGLLSAVGRDPEGDALIAAASGMGLICHHVHRCADLPTDCYMAIEGAGGLIAAVADAHSLEAAGGQILRPLADGQLGSATRPWAGPIALDGNLTAALIAEIAGSPLFAAADLRVASASPGKSARLAPLLGHPRATFYLNRAEAAILCRTDFADAAAAVSGLVARGARRVLVTDGARAAADGTADGVFSLPPPAVPVRRITGAGDTFMAAHLVAERHGATRTEALSAALGAAARHVSGEIAR